MGPPNKYTSKFIAGLCISILFLYSNITSADTLPNEDIINRLAEDAKLTIDTFMQQSFMLRMQYEYSGKFLTADDKENLHQLADNASEKLRQITENQKTLKQQIEEYNGSDWEQKYGSTGLWRKLSVDIHTAKSNKLEIGYYLALASEHEQQNRKLHSILSEIDELLQNSRQFGPNLTRGKTLALLAQIEPSYKKDAEREFEKLTDESDFYLSAIASIEKMKLLRHADANQLNTLAETLNSNWDDRYPELILSLMFLQRRYDPKGFEKTLSLWPDTEDLIASLALADLSYNLEKQQNLQQISTLEAELAALAAWKNETENNINLITFLSNKEKFQTTLILYVTARALAESSPAETVSLLIKASKLQHQKKDNRLDIDSGKIAEQAAQLAYNLFLTESNCPLAIESFDNYYTIAGEKIDEELEYLYTTILNNCSRSEEAKEVLEKIAGRSAGKYHDRARLDLILYEMLSCPHQQNKHLEKLGNFILSCSGQDKKSNELRIKAINVYCKTVLESEDKIYIEKALEILTNTESTAGINIDLFKAQALQKLGKLDQSAHYMLLAIQDDSGSLAEKVSELLAEFIDKIDEFETEPNNPYSPEMMNNCKKLAQFSHLSLNNRQSAMFLAEISIFTAGKDKEKLSEADKLLKDIAADTGEKDIDLLRCQARLLFERAEFDKAAPLWARIAEMQKNQLPQKNRQSWKWWRAKYYELYCWAQNQQTKNEEVLHTIEILENSFTDIPSFWAEKLNSLKHLCRNNLSKGK